MDALALLCTLHADGPATLKRLRARGYPDLATLIHRSAEELSADLEVEPAYARRLLREAKHLAVRVGAEGLEAEEAPPVVTTGSGRESGEGAGEPMPPSIPIAHPEAGEQPSTLDDSDRSLVERIVGQATPAVEEPEEAAAVERTPASQLESEPEPAAESVAESVAEPEPGLLTANSLPGLDAELLQDLHASGIRTLSDLAQAESLQLTRALGITFAQARRLGFLARRGASPVAAKVEAKVDLVESVRETVRRYVPEPKAAPSAEPTRAVQESAEPPLSYTAPVVPIPRDTTPPPVAPLEPVAPKPSERQPFWTPRKFLADTAVPEAAPQQGVKVDPSEIAPRPRFGDRLAQAAALQRQSDRTSSAAPAAARSSARPARPSEAGAPEARTGQTVLGWNFEIPRPVDEPALPLGSVAVPEEPKTQEQNRVEPVAPTLRGQSRDYSAGVSVPRNTAKDQDHGGPFA
ncbi:DNA repair and recombination protein RadA [Planctomycetes bacterium Poly30]|uniref:DNA repair and recombination protein RadA n=1 Tax=Saltatorellus ferox TaxID=2528018 RepID=A0A518EXT0_9BACT|nr:DNA repair and recombination protein RadA [Planctomycetes bacterium Poly30]